MNGNKSTVQKHNICVLGRAAESNAAQCVLLCGGVKIGDSNPERAPVTSAVCPSERG